MDDTSLSAVLLFGRNERVSMKLGGRRVVLVRVELLKSSRIYSSMGTIVNAGAVPMLKSSSKFMVSKTSFELFVRVCGISTEGNGGDVVRVIKRNLSDIIRGLRIFLLLVEQKTYLTCAER